MLLWTILGIILTTLAGIDAPAASADLIKVSSQYGKLKFEEEREAEAGNAVVAVLS